MIATAYDYANLENLYEVEENITNAINEVLLSGDIQQRDRSFLGRQLLTEEAYLYAREMRSSITAKAYLLADIKGGRVQSSNVSNYIEKETLRMISALPHYLKWDTA